MEKNWKIGDKVAWKGASGAWVLGTVIGMPSQPAIDGGNCDSVYVEYCSLPDGQGCTNTHLYKMNRGDLLDGVEKTYTVSVDFNDNLRKIFKVKAYDEQDAHTKVNKLLSNSVLVTLSTELSPE